MSRTIYYLSVDGAMEPLGTSQVVRYLERLAPISSCRFVLITLEKAEHLSDPDRVRAMKKRLSLAGVDWRYRDYSYGATGMPANVAFHVDSVLNEGTKDNAIVWARGYVSAFAARILRVVEEIPYIFDTRGYWFDERLPAGGLFANPAFYRSGKVVERSLFRNASGIIALTEQVLEDLDAGVFGTQAKNVRIVVPTCASFEEFRPDVEPHPKMPVISTNALVIGYVGSINTAYQVEASFDLFGRIRQRTDAHLLCLTRQVDEARSLVDRLGISRDDVTIRSAVHDEMPAWVAALDYGLLLRGPTFAKRASMPTKLAEFFAAGVRPIAYPCNESMRDWVTRVGTGLVLQDAGANELERAAEWVAKPRSRPSMARREMAAAHFGLASAIPRLNRFVDLVLERL